MRLGQAATPRAGIHRLPTSTQLVLVDVGDHPGTSVSEVVSRTGLPQSLVSAAVTRLREGGALITETDPRDRRRTLVSPSPAIAGRKAQVPTTPLEDVLRAELGLEDPHEIAHVMELLTELSTLFERA